jgi:hypothetical protein
MNRRTFLAFSIQAPLIAQLQLPVSGGVARSPVNLARMFARLEDNAAKVALALELFGRSGEQLIPMLNEMGSK